MRHKFDLENRIKELRKKAGMTLQDVAAECATTAATIQKLENGAIPLTQRWMQRLAVALECEIVDIIAPPKVTSKPLPPQQLMFVNGDHLVAWHSSFSSIRVARAADYAPARSRPTGTVAVLIVADCGIEKSLDLSAEAVAWLVRALQATLEPPR